MTWKDLVAQALAELGGEGHLTDINRLLKGHPKTATNPTWQDTIRRVVRQYGIFEPLPPDRSGRYRLVMPAEIPAEIATLDAADAEVDHGVAQGMLVTLGRLHGYETYVPKTDQTIRRFQGRPLSEVVSVRDCDDLFDDRSIRKVREIDVLWFAEDDQGLYPVYAFEVEHTTRVKDGLDRLLKIPERFHSRLFVVGPDAGTGALFDTLVSQSPFRQHRSRFTYRLYEDLEALHNATVQSEELREEFGIARHGVR